MQTCLCLGCGREQSATMTCNDGRAGAGLGSVLGPATGGAHIAPSDTLTARVPLLMHRRQRVSVALDRSMATVPRTRRVRVTA